MRRRWLVIGACLAIAVTIGFQQAEPLDELRQFGTLHAGVGHVGLDEYSFVPAGMSAKSFVASLAVLPRCKSVRELVVPKTTFLGDHLARVAKCNHVVSLRMRRIDADDRDLAALAGMRHLEFLDLSRNPAITDTGVAALSGLENLRCLDLTSTKVTGAGLKNRADMVSLEQLKLENCPVSDESLMVIPRFPKLTLLDLGKTQVTDTGLMSLVGWHSLQQLFWSDRMTIEGQRAFNAAFLAARRKAREAGVPMDSRDVPPIFFNKEVGSQ